VATKKENTAAAASAISAPVAEVARLSRLASAQRVDLGKLLTTKDFRKLADADTDVGAQITQVTKALADVDAAATAWQQDLAAATAWWDACRTTYAAIHPGRPIAAAGLGPDHV
jgi:hypothetical protein